MLTVPKSAISQSDDSGASVDPEVGDEVDLGKAKAEVMSIDGDNVCLSIKSVNGKDAVESSDEPDDAAGAGDEPADDPRTGMPMTGEGAALMAKAEAADKRKGY